MYRPDSTAQGFDAGRTASAAGGAKKLARAETLSSPKRVKFPRWLRVVMVAVLAPGALGAQVPEPDLPRPGSVVVADATGDVAVVGLEPRRVVKTDDRLRVGATLATGRRSMVSLLLSNGAQVQLGAESELELEEFGQAPVSNSVKFAELKQEPSVSRTRLRLARGNVTLVVKPLNLARGSSFSLAVPAGMVRASEGTIHAMLQMSDLGLGVCHVEVKSGKVEFEAAGTTGFVAVPAGRRLAFALDVDKATGAVKLSEMPKEVPARK